MSRLGFTKHPFTIFTDGSYTNETSFFHKLLHGIKKTDNKASGAVVLIMDGPGNYSTRKVLAIQITNHNNLDLSSAYPAELLSLLIALHISQISKPQKIWVDCDSLLSKIKADKKQLKPLETDYSILAKHLLAIVKVVDKTDILHVYSHAIDIMAESKMNAEQRGNDIADKVAGGNLDYVNQRCPNITHHTLEFSHFLETDVKPHLSLHLVKAGKILITSIKKEFDSQMTSEYREHRSEESSMGKDYWIQSTYHLANKAWNLDIAGNLNQRSSANRIIFNKLWLPWNEYRFAPTDTILTGTCNICESAPDSMKHLLCECTHVSIDSLRMSNRLARLQLIADSADNDIAVIVYDHLETMLNSTAPEHIYMSMWLPEQEHSFTTYLSNHVNINIQRKEHQSAIEEALITYAQMLAVNTQLLVRQRLQFNKQRSKKIGCFTKLQTCFLRQPPNITALAIAKQLQRQRKKPKKKLSHNQAITNQTLYNFWKQKSDQAEAIRKTTQRALAAAYENPFPLILPTTPRSWELIPFLDNRESAIAKMANQDKRYCAWWRERHPKRRIAPQFTEEQEKQRTLASAANQLRRSMSFKRKMRENADHHNRKSTQIATDALDYG